MAHSSTIEKSLLSRNSPTIWLVPDRRVADAIQPRTPFVTVHTFDTLAGDIIQRLHPATRPLSRGQQALLVAELIDESQRAGELAPFAKVADSRGFADAVLTLIDQSRREGGVSDDPRCLELIERYRETLTRARLIDHAGRVAFAADLVERHGNPISWPIVAHGFDVFTQPQRRLLDLLGAEVTEATKAAGQSIDTLPCSLRCVREHLFDDPAPPASANADGLFAIEAPGTVGELRLVARAIKRLLLEGTSADAVVVAVRHVDPSADLIAEVFDEYGIPVDIEGTDPLSRNPCVGMLLRAARLPDEDWPFAGVTALLRSTFFQPTWPEAADGLPAKSETLLRLLGEPRHRESYERAVTLWADTPPTGLEDESAEEPRRLRMQRLAVECRPFLGRFFRAWDTSPRSATPGRHGDGLRRLADDLGFADVALDRLWVELREWARRSHKPLPRGQFHRLLATLTRHVGLARTPRGPGRVRALSAERACQLPVAHLFVVGLGERGFPNPQPTSPLSTESESSASVLEREQRLFSRLLTRATSTLTLSYAAVDERGQSLLPSPFLRAVRSLFTTDAIPTLRQRMLIEGYDRRLPLCPAEERVRAALRMREVGTDASTLPADTAAQLRTAHALHQARFRDSEFNASDGRLRNPEVVSDLRRRFGPDRVYSPTALERYVACPFRFFLEQVLKLEPLEDPREEIEHTRRGAAFHRALSRLHVELRAETDHPTLPYPPPSTDEHLRKRLTEAVAEYAARAPSAAARVLWELEGQRLQRSAARYAAHWEKFVEPWRKASALPRPWRFEADFGLPPVEGAEPSLEPLILRGDGLEVRIGGRIDRVDLAEMSDGVGFWIIDYKTGRAEHYTAADLTSFRKLQLPLYALAVERVFLADRPGRPLGMAYWLVTDTGPKVVLPGRNATTWLTDPSPWRQFADTLEAWVTTLVGHVRAGDFPLAPRSDQCTQTCPYGQTCRITQSRGNGKAFDLPLPVLPQVEPPARKAG